MHRVAPGVIRERRYAWHLRGIGHEILPESRALLPFGVEPPGLILSGIFWATLYKRAIASLKGACALKRRPTLLKVVADR
jgi:hypothetical protein